MAYIYNMADTWADAGTTFTAIKMNVLDTASNAASLLMDLQVGGVSRFGVRKNGTLVAGDSAIATLALTSPTGLTNGDGISFNGGEVVVRRSNNIHTIFDSTGCSVRLTNGTFSLSTDTILARDAADILAQRRTTNAQAFRVYNTFTDASNYERGFVRWATNVLEIGTENAGTGSARSVSILGTSTTVSGSTLVDIKQGSNVVRSFAGAFYPDNTNLPLGTTSKRWGNFFQNGYSDLIEISAPAAPAVNGVRIYAEDNGSGKTRLMALFATGAAVQIAIEP
jgi:hypothetical protein